MRLLHLISVTLITVLIVSCAGRKALTDQQRNYTKIGEHSLSKEEAFDKVLEWFATNYMDSKEVIQLKNKKKGKIIGRGGGKYFIDPLKTQVSDYYYTLTVDLKDEKIRFNFEISGYVQQRFYDQIKEKMDNTIQTVMESLEATSDDW